MKKQKRSPRRRFGPRSLLWLGFALCCAAFAAYFAATRGVGDRKAPQITVPPQPLQVSVYDERQALLQGVTAQDQRDGDVTASLVVESVGRLQADHTAVVTYAAFDEAHNVAKAQRTVQYTDYRCPRFTLSGPLIFAEGGAGKVFDVIGAQDALDGELDDRVKATLAQGDSYMTKAGAYRVEFRVTNSLGDTVHQVLPVQIVEPKQDRKRLELTDYLVYLPVGEPLDPETYLKPEKPTRADGPELPRRPVHWETDLDADRPGVYTVTYVDDSERPLENTCLIVIVEE